MLVNLQNHTEYDGEAEQSVAQVVGRARAHVPLLRDLARRVCFLSVVFFVLCW